MSVASTESVPAAVANALKSTVPAPEMVTSFEVDATAERLIGPSEANVVK